MSWALGRASRTCYTGAGVKKLEGNAEILRYEEATILGIFDWNSLGGKEMRILPIRTQLKIASVLSITVGAIAMLFSLGVWVFCRAMLETTLAQNPDGGIPGLIKAFRAVVFGICPGLSFCLVGISFSILCYLKKEPEKKVTI
jgi:hypothetical protein